MHNSIVLNKVPEIRRKSFCRNQFGLKSNFSLYGRKRTIHRQARMDIMPVNFVHWDRTSLPHSWAKIFKIVQFRDAALPQSLKSAF